MALTISLIVVVLLAIAIVVVRNNIKNSEANERAKKNFKPTEDGKVHNLTRDPTEKGEKKHDF